MYKALKTFAGKVSMRRGEVKAISDPIIVKDLLKAGYIEEVKPAKGKPVVEEEKTEEEKPEEKPKKKTKAD